MKLGSSFFSELVKTRRESLIYAMGRGLSEDYTRDASRLMAVFSNLLIGQFNFASSADSLNFSGLMPGIFGQEWGSSL